MKHAPSTSSIMLPALCTVAAFADAAPASEEHNETIVTANVVKLEESISPEGFVHPGISCNAATLSVMREKVIAGVSPWVDYFEGLRRTRYSNIHERPRRVGQIVNDGGIGAFAQDAQLAWGQTILYVVSGDERYRRLPVEIIKWYGARTEQSFFPRGFADSHIKIGKYVYTMCTAADILRYTTPTDPALAVTADMIDALQTHCIMPIRKNSIERNWHFMNQHSYAIMGYLASTIMSDDVGGYREAVEWTTVNAATANWGRSGSIKHQIRLVTRNDKTGERVEPNLQLVEMGRDQPHAGGNIDNLMMMAKTIEIQKTKVDPIRGTVTAAADGVSPLRFLNDRLLKGAVLFTKYNLGYGLPWVPTYSETSPGNMVTYDQISPAGRGRLGVGNGAAAAYHYFKGMGFEMDSGPHQCIKTALQAGSISQERRARSGQFIDTVHNYAFDFWIGLPATSSETEADPAKARRALATKLPPLEIRRGGNLVRGKHFEDCFVDLSANAVAGDIYPGASEDAPLAVRADAGGVRYVRMTLGRGPRTMVVFAHSAPGSGLRVRADKLVKLNFYTNEDYSRRGPAQTIHVPDTAGEWRYVTTAVGMGDITYIEATSLDGHATLDFDRIETEPDQVLPLTFHVPDGSKSFPTYAGAKIDRTYAATCPDRRLSNGAAWAPGKVEYAARNLPAGAVLGRTSGRFVWTPTVEQAGDHTIYITASTALSVNVLPVSIHVAPDLQGALDYAARRFDPNEKYESDTEQAFTATLKSRDLAALVKAARQLAPLTPTLPDGSLDYCKTWSDKICGSQHMADSDPLSWGGVWGFDKNVTMDFGNRFKVKTDRFAIRARDGFPIRVAESVVYGSNDGVNWTLLTRNRAKSSAELQTLWVKEEEKDSAYRYLRFFMPARPFHIFEISTLRIFGERIEDYSPDYHVAYIRGRNDGLFRPDRPLSRAEAASALAGLVDDYTDKGAYECRYADVDPESSCYDDVAYMSMKKFIAADANNHFRPDAPVTRGELADMMARMNHLRGEADSAFPDVADDTPHAAAIRLVADKGWLTATPDGAFRPSASVTRAAFVAAANRMRQRSCPGPFAGAPAFADVPRSHWAYREIMEAATTHPVP